jgi:hypothetical protein
VRWGAYLHPQVLENYATQRWNALRLFAERPFLLGFTSLAALANKMHSLAVRTSMKNLTNLLFCTALAAGMIAATARLDAKPEYSKKEKTGCITCHVKAGSKELNEKGTYYKEHKALPPAK